MHVFWNFFLSGFIFVWKFPFNRENFREVSIKQFLNKLVHLKLSQASSSLLQIMCALTLTSSFILFTNICVCAFRTPFEIAIYLLENLMLTKRKLRAFSLYLSINVVPWGKGRMLNAFLRVGKYVRLPYKYNYNWCTSYFTCFYWINIKYQLLLLMPCSSSNLFKSYCFFCVFPLVGTYHPSQ